MSLGQACTCAERHKPIAEREWYVLQRNCNHSAFNGGRRQYSRYSSITCEGTDENGRRCLGSWRTKAAYVIHLRDYVFKKS